MPNQIVPQCDSDNDPSNGLDGICNFCDLLVLAENIINFLVYFAVFVAVLMFVYAGFLYLTAGGSSGQITKAHNVFRATILGFVLTLAAWLIIDLVVTAFLSNDLKTALGGSWGSLPGC